MRSAGCRQTDRTGPRPSRDAPGYPRLLDGGRWSMAAEMIETTTIDAAGTGRAHTVDTPPSRPLPGHVVDSGRLPGTGDARHAGAQESHPPGARAVPRADPAARHEVGPTVRGGDVRGPDVDGSVLPRASRTGRTSAWALRAVSAGRPPGWQARSLDSATRDRRNVPAAVFTEHSPTDTHAASHRDRGPHGRGPCGALALRRVRYRHDGRDRRSGRPARARRRARVLCPVSRFRTRRGHANRTCPWAVSVGTRRAWVDWSVASPDAHRGRRGDRWPADEPMIISAECGPCRPGSRRPLAGPAWFRLSRGVVAGACPRTGTTRRPAWVRQSGPTGARSRWLAELGRLRRPGWPWRGLNRYRRRCPRRRDRATAPTIPQFSLFQPYSPATGR